MRLDSQFCRMNCQMFSWGLSSGARGGSGRNLEIFGAVPASLIEDEDCVSASGDPCGDLVEMKLHGFGVAERENEGSAGSAFGADRTEQIGRLGALIMSGSGARARPGPAIGELVLLADPCLVLPPELYALARMCIPDCRHALRETLWNGPPLRRRRA